MPRVSTAIVGCGQRGASHARAVRACDLFDLKLVCDLDESRARGLGETVGAEYTTDPDDVMSREEIEAVIVATPTKYHGDIAIAAVEAGKHLLVEKPMVDSVERGRELLVAAERSGVVGMVAYQLRFTDFGRALKNEAERMRPLQALMTSQRGVLLPQYFIRDHYGGIMDSASHTIDRALWVMEGVPSGVYASLRRGTFRSDQTIDFANLMIEYEGGRRTATVIASMGGIGLPNVVHVVAKFGNISSTDGRTLKIVTHRGFKADKTPIGLETRTVSAETSSERSKDPTLRMLENFAESVRGRAPPQGASLHEGMLEVAVSEAMVKSAEKGRRVELRDVEAP